MLGFGRNGGKVNFRGSEDRRKASDDRPQRQPTTIPFPITTDLSTVGFLGLGEWYSYNVISGQIEAIPLFNPSGWGIQMPVSVFTKDIFSCQK